MTNVLHGWSPERVISSIHRGDDCTWSFWYNYVLCVSHMYPSNANFTITSIVKLLCQLKVSLVRCSWRIPISSIGDPKLHDSLVVGLAWEYFLATFWNSSIYKFVSRPACLDGQLYKGQQIKVQQVVLVCLDCIILFYFIVVKSLNYPLLLSICIRMSMQCSGGLNKGWRLRIVILYHTFWNSGRSLPLIFCIHVRSEPIYWGGYLPCKNDYKVMVFYM
jgi:hypothetical protein